MFHLIKDFVFGGQLQFYFVRNYIHCWFINQITFYNIMHRSFVPVRSSKYLLTLFMCSWMDSIMACDTVLKSKLPFMSNTRRTSSPPYRLARFLNILTITSSLSSICSKIYSTQCCWSLLKMLLAVGPILSASVRGLHHLNPLQKPLGGASP